ncbi:TetR/AcrR family transcriptional regulator [Nodosilinea sp. LEGE 07088]|uniref:TetR/AcrR family transcriptional regulator n=1 Tax=Nodosilinea sp. LEGE 07088 TaxID=2777968 RepID=UPI001882E2E3|nr:TetR/AcrR family transcriptional regulator [Nodosilinea sp. LEGE 07088]MBE9135912.1 TetR/AcrR family transcriptional regulator [Nodosilinea sp. LEGE 07088]
MPKIVDHDQYRRTLLSQCFDLFADHGYASLTTRQIAKALGVSTGTLYYYFPSKEDLFMQLIEELTEQDLLRATAKIEGLSTLRERILALGDFLEANEDYFIKQTLLMMDFYQQAGVGQSRVNEAVQRVSERSRDEIMAVLQLENPLVATHILCLIDGLIAERMVNPAMVSYRQQAELLADLLTAYLERPKGEAR